MEVIIVLVLLVVNWPIFRMIANVFFRDKTDMQQSMRYLVTPDIVSLFRGEYRKDRFAQAKLSFFLMCCILLVLGEALFIKMVISAITQ